MLFSLFSSGKIRKTENIILLQHDALKLKCIQKVSEYDQEKPQSHTAVQPTALRKSNRAYTVTRHP